MLERCHEHPLDGSKIGGAVDRFGDKLGLFFMGKLFVNAIN